MKSIEWKDTDGFLIATLVSTSVLFAVLYAYGIEQLTGV
jgi:hypothetical protein